MRNIIAVLILCFMTWAGTGCSVYMAANGADNPDLGMLRPGVAKSEIDMEFGKPKRYDLEQRRGLYHYTTGEEGSTGRALGHAAGDVLTLGLWEIVGTPVEAFQDETKWAIDIYYDQDARVSRWNPPRQR